MPRSVFLAMCLAIAAVAIASCQTVSNDLGTGCLLVKANPSSDAGLSIPVLNSELTAGKDFLSFGSTDCDNLVCVHDQFMGTEGAPDQPAHGYCSTPCSTSSRTDCATDRNAQQYDFPGPTRPLTCRSLLLDPNTIAAFCDPKSSTHDQCAATFGSTQTSFFCARDDAGTPDAGS